MAEEIRPNRPLEAGARLGGFELLSLVGQGGMGAVWVARPVNGDPRALVAVKTILPHEASDPVVRAMFLDEARVARLLAHPNACALVDYGNDDGTLYMVMEWVEGDSLRSLSTRSSSPDMPWEVALRIVRRVCDALHVAHELRGADGEALGLVHRDVSPHNILVSASGDVKLIDFGIAKTRARVAETTNSGIVKGKLRYLAPEQVDGSHVDRRADVWALGAVLWSLVCGEELHGGMTEAEIFRALVMREPLAPPPPHLPRAVVDILSRALVVDREQRFPTAHAMRTAIDAVLGDTGDDRPFVTAFVAHRLQAPIARRRDAIEDARASISARHRLTRSRKRWRHFGMGAVALAAIAAVGSVAFASRSSHAPAAVVAAMPSPVPFRPVGPTPTSALPEPAARPTPMPTMPAPSSPRAQTTSDRGTSAAAVDGKKRAAKLPPKPRGGKLGGEFDTHD